MRIATNLHTFVSSALTFNLLQYLSINESGVVWYNIVLSVLAILHSSSLMIDTAFQNQLDLSYLPKGIYFLMVQNTSGGQLTRKVILSE